MSGSVVRRVHGWDNEWVGRLYILVVGTVDYWTVSKWLEQWVGGWYGE